MAKPVQNQDINYQPETKSFAYQNPGNKNSSNSKKMNTFFILGLGIFGILVLIFIFLGILNYFNIVSVTTFLPNQFNNPSVTPDPFLIEAKKNDEKNIPKPVFLPSSNLWYGQGTLVSYKDSQIVVEVGKTIVKLQFSSSESTFYKSRSSFGLNSTDSASKIERIPYTLYDLEQKENLGKNLEVFYTIDKSEKNTIKEITLTN